MPKTVKKKKQFICKKDATTYQLIPGYVEQDEVQPVGDDIPNDPSVRKQQQREVGIFFDDDYNYMKHLRSVEEQGTLVNVESFRVDRDDETRSEMSRASMPPLPFREFFSTDETEGERIDPEVLAALEEAPVVKLDDDDMDGEKGDDDFFNDDFIALAGGVVAEKHKKTEEEDEEYVGSDDREFDFDEEEDECSGDDVTDSNDEDSGSDIEDRLKVPEVHRGRGTTQDDIVEAQTALILRNFEEGLGFRCSLQQSDEVDEMPTAQDYENLKRILNEDKFTQKPISLIEVLDDRTDRPQIDPNKYLYDDVDEFEWKDVPPSKPKFDAVSILSLNSNTRNLPTDIVPPRKESKKKPGSSVSESSQAVGQPGLTLQQLDGEMRESRRADKTSTFRPKDETAQEKKARKKAVKDERKDRRQEKKANREVFSQEKQKMMKETAALAKAVKGVVIS